VWCRRSFVEFWPTRVEPSTISGSGPGGSITRATPSAPSLTVDEEMVVALSNVVAVWDNTWRLSPGTPHGFVAIEADGAVFAKLDALGRSTRDGVAISDEMLVSLAAVRALAEFEFLNATFGVNNSSCTARSISVLVRSVADDGMLYRSSTRRGLTLRALARRVSETRRTCRLSPPDDR